MQIHKLYKVYLKVLQSMKTTKMGELPKQSDFKQSRSSLDFPCFDVLEYSLPCYSDWHILYVRSHVAICCKRPMLSGHDNYNFTVPHHPSYILTGHLLHHRHHLPLPRHCKVLLLVVSVEITERLSMTFMANGKNETFAVSLQLCVQ